MSDRTENIRDLKRISGSAALDFSNTADREQGQVIVERLHTYADFIEWSAAAAILDEMHAGSLYSMAQTHPAEAQTALTTAVTLRELIYRIGSDLASQKKVDQAVVASFNHYLHESSRHRTLQQRGASFGWVWAWTEEPQTLEYPIWKLVQFSADLLMEGAPNVRECAAPDCGWLFVDTSRNHSRKWCDMNDCGNREKAKRHYRRSKQS